MIKGYAKLTIEMPVDIKEDFIKYCQRENKTQKEVIVTLIYDVINSRLRKVNK